MNIKVDYRECSECGISFPRTEGASFNLDLFCSKKCREEFINYTSGDSYATTTENKPLDKRVLETDHYQPDLFPEYAWQKEKQVFRRWIHLLTKAWQ